MAWEALEEFYDAEVENVLNTLTQVKTPEEAFCAAMRLKATSDLAIKAKAAIEQGKVAERRLSEDE